MTRSKIQYTSDEELESLVDQIGVKVTSHISKALLEVRKLGKELHLIDLANVDIDNIQKAIKQVSEHGEKAKAVKNELNKIENSLETAWDDIIKTETEISESETIDRLKEEKSSIRGSIDDFTSPVSIQANESSPDNGWEPSNVGNA